MKEKKKGPAARKPIGPKRMTEAKRKLNAKPASRENQYLLLKFDKDHPGLTFDEADSVLVFVRWLKEKGYHIISKDDIFSFRFSHLVKKKKCSLERQI